MLEAWKTFEEQNGTEEQKATVQEMMPTTRKRWRKAEDGSGQLEEYWDLAFPDDERDANPSSYKFFKAAQEWAASKSGAGGIADGALGAGGLSYDMPDDSDDESEGEEDEDEADKDDEDAADGPNEAEAMDED